MMFKTTEVDMIKKFWSAKDIKDYKAVLENFMSNLLEYEHIAGTKKELLSIYSEDSRIKPTRYQVEISIKEIE